MELEDSALSCVMGFFFLLWLSFLATGKGLALQRHNVMQIDELRLLTTRHANAARGWRGFRGRHNGAKGQRLVFTSGGVSARKRHTHTSRRA